MTFWQTIAASVIAAAIVSGAGFAIAINTQSSLNVNEIDRLENDVKEIKEKLISVEMGANTGDVAAGQVSSKLEAMIGAQSGIDWDELRNFMRKVRTSPPLKDCEICILPVGNTRGPEESGKVCYSNGQSIGSARLAHAFARVERQNDINFGLKAEIICEKL